MKKKILGIVALLGLFATGSALAADYRHGDRYNKNSRSGKVVTKTVKVIERPHSTTRIVTRNNGNKQVTTRHTSRVVSNHHRSYRAHPSKRVVEKRVVVQKNNNRKNDERLGLLVGGIVLGSILAGH